MSAGRGLWARGDDRRLPTPSELRSGRRTSPPRARALGTAALAFAGILCACGGADPDGAARQRAEARASALRGPRDAQETHEEVGRVRVAIRGQGGDVTRLGQRGGGALELAAGEGLRVGAGGHVQLDPGTGHQVELGAEADVEVGDEGLARLLLAAGPLEVLAPQDTPPLRVPLRVATPAATIEFGDDAVAFVQVHPTGAVWVACLASPVTVSSGDVDARRRTRELALEPGRAVLVGARTSEVSDGPQALADAPAAAALAFATAPAPDAERLGRDLAEAAGRIDEALLWLESETRRGRELTRAHRAASGAGGTQDGARLQRELIAHGQLVYALRQTATVRWERLLVGERAARRTDRRLFLEGSEARRDRVTGLLGH